MLTPTLIDWDVVEMLNIPIGRQKLGITNLGGFIPLDHAEVTGPFDTTSATLVDVPNLVVNLIVQVKSRIMLWLSIDLDGVGGGGPTRIGYTVSIDGVDQTEYFLDFSASDTFNTGAMNHVSGNVLAGVHTVQARMRRISGPQTARATVGMLTCMAMPVP